MIIWVFFLITAGVYTLVIAASQIRYHKRLLFHFASPQASFFPLWKWFTLVSASHKVLSNHQVRCIGDSEALHICCVGQGMQDRWQSFCSGLSPITSFSIKSPLVSLSFWEFFLLLLHIPIDFLGLRNILQNTFLCPVVAMLGLRPLLFF